MSEHYIKDFSRAEAWALAQFVKRVCWAEIRANAKDEAEAYIIRDALLKLGAILSSRGYDPR